MKIVLLGYMGSGKSTVGKELAAILGWEFLDLDAYIENKLQASIPELFKAKGEIFFRKKEHEFLKEVLALPGKHIVALGGGTPCYAGNMDLLLQHTQNVFYLKLTVPALTARLAKEKEQRPLIQRIPEDELAEFIGKHLFERSSFYNRAPHIISADTKSVREIVQEITCTLI